MCDGRPATCRAPIRARTESSPRALRLDARRKALWECLGGCNQLGQRGHVGGEYGHEFGEAWVRGQPEPRREDIVHVLHVGGELLGAEKGQLLKISHGLEQQRDRVSSDGLEPLGRAVEFTQ